ncbi:ribosomal protein S18-alanine N-acetyltransferase [Nocardiopsis exhalans]|uniref:Ribosomal protein S18-alanine N-acetyltransferase n=1 Tax=Nocardiopsis exhalans TaxID=163604 RepID=A0ABY5DIX2_9ACTN|nr:ribosomal protein S18-alanine N-acetyltransferase [Nocardiopsis exhalans]USY23484.1 ribosomal protein S18-alanine N-acetyltransferase [Nocardiopsis exhalans]
MTGDDVPAVLELERALFPLDAWSEGMLRDELAETATRHYVVAEATEPGSGAGGPIVGYAGLRFVPPEGDVQTMAVAETAWGRGIGRALLTELLAQAEARGVTHMFLEVRSDNPRAQDLYTRFGFEAIGVRRGYYNGADAIVMRRVAAGEVADGEGEGQR